VRTPRRQLKSDPIKKAVAPSDQVRNYLDPKLLHTNPPRSHPKKRSNPALKNERRQGVSFRMRTFLTDLLEVAAASTAARCTTLPSVLMSLKS